MLSMSERGSHLNVKHIVNKINMLSMSMLLAGNRRSDVRDRHIIVEPQWVVKEQIQTCVLIWATLCST